MENDTSSMTELSPATQAVMTAYVNEDRAGRLAVAAALRAAIAAGHDYDSSLIIKNILAIAAELESQ